MIHPIDDSTNQRLQFITYEACTIYPDFPHTQKKIARTNITEKNPTKTKQVVEPFLYKLGVTSKRQFQ
jgi:hypothetical protein